MRPAFFISATEHAHFIMLSSCLEQWGLLHKRTHVANKKVLTVSLLKTPRSRLWYLWERVWVCLCGFCFGKFVVCTIGFPCLLLSDKNLEIFVCERVSNKSYENFLGQITVFIDLAIFLRFSRFSINTLRQYKYFCQGLVLLWLLLILKPSMGFFGYYLFRLVIDQYCVYLLITTVSFADTAVS